MPGLTTCNAQAAAMTSENECRLLRARIRALEGAFTRPGEAADLYLFAPRRKHRMRPNELRR